MGIMGLLTKDKQPLVEHAVESSAKFSAMRGNLQQAVGELDEKNLLVEDENTALDAQKKFLEEVLKREEKRNEEHRLETEKVLSDNNDKLKASQKRFEELQRDAKKVGDTYKAIWEEHGRVTKAERIKTELKEVAAGFKQEHDDIEKGIVREKGQVLAESKQRLALAEEDFKKDPRFIEAQAENEDLKEKLKKSDKELHHTSYKVKEFEELRKVAERERLAEIELRKQATRDLEKAQDRLKSRREEVEARLEDKKTRQEQEPETKKIDADLQRKEKELEELKKRNELSEGNYKKLREEVLKMRMAVEGDKAENLKLLEQERQLTAEVNAADTELNKETVEMEKLQLETAALQEEATQALQRLRRLEEEHSFLVAKHKYLEEHVRLDDNMKNLRVEELRSLTQSNSHVNETVQELLNKWEQLRKFSKDSA